MEEAAESGQAEGDLMPANRMDGNGTIRPLKMQELEIHVRNRWRPRPS